MNKPIPSVRESFEKTCTAIVSMAIIAFMTSGLFAMCVPGIGMA